MADFAKSIQSLRDDLLLVAETLDEVCKNVNIARVVGSSVAATGSAVALIAAPFTMGASLVPIIIAGVFAGLGTLGSLTSSGAAITGDIIEKLKLRELQPRWEKFQQEYRCCIAGIQGCSVGDIVQMAKTMGASGKLVKDQVDAIVGIIGMANRATTDAATTATAEASPAAAATMTATAKAATVATGKAATAATAEATTTSARLAMVAQAPIIGVNVVLLGFSISDIVDASIELHKKKKSKGGDLLREVVAQLDTIIINNQKKI